MPFNNNTHNLLGKYLLFEPLYGNGWMLYTPEKPLQPIEFPPPFQVLLVDLIIDEGEVRALICQMGLALEGHSFDWGAFIARSDSFIDLPREHVWANLLLSNEKPTRSQKHPYHHPGFMQANSEIEVRGFGTLSLGK